MLDDLSEDAIISIFSWLPAKTLLRLRSVSKSLCARISGRSFIRLQSLRSPKRFIFIHQADEYEEEDTKRVYTMHSESQLSYNPSITPVEFPFTKYITVGSCNGILCVLEHSIGRIHLWNPSIRRKVTLHDIPYLSIHGFGFDPLIDDYKILTISQPWLSSVYTLKTRTLRAIASPTTPFSHVITCQCDFNGSLHWIAGGYLTTVGHNVWHDYILTFDLSSEVFSTIELPVPSWEASIVTVIKGSLAVISSKHNDCTIWVRNKYNDNTAASWSVAYKLDTNPFKGAYDVWQIIPNDELLFCDKAVVVYNLETRIKARLVNMNDSLWTTDMSICVESLALLDMLTW